ncbi:MAG: hypothetical protein JNN15_02695 [Blastocatellia bacterium]|nr:hypothetical protein [Blastocatellia bacterium]
MPGIQIKAEKPPKRCEICHQTDMFNPQTGECLRCGTLAEKTSSTTKVLGFNFHSDALSSLINQHRSKIMLVNRAAGYMSIVSWLGLVGSILATMLNFLLRNVPVIGTILNFVTSAIFAYRIFVGFLLIFLVSVVLQAIVGVTERVFLDKK